MAPRTETSERELNTEINAAIAGTEDEIFREAMDASLDDNDGDRELEEMGEGLEGQPLDEDDIEIEDTVGPDDDEEDEEDDGGDDTVAETDESEDEEQDEPPARDARQGRQAPQIPPGRLREVSQRARQVELERDEYRNRYDTLEARFNDLNARINAQQVGPQANQQQQQAPVKPDMFADPDGYERWVLEEAERRVEGKLDQRLAQRDQQQQEAINARVDQSFNEASTGPRGIEFSPAYNALRSLSPRDPQAQRLVRGIFNSPDPAQSLFDWWDESGGSDEFRENIARQLGLVQEPQRRVREDRGEARQQQRQVRHEIRQPQRLRSLNSASGGNSHRVSDPEMLDGSEDSVFRYATQR